MKQNFKKYLKLGVLLFGISVILLNCQDLEEIQTTENNLDFVPTNFSTKIIYPPDIEQNKVLKESLGSLNSKSSQASSSNSNKTVYLEDYGFSINTDFGTYLENSNKTYHSYAFKVLRDSTDFSLENLVFSLNGDGGYDIYLAQYTLDEDDIYLLQNKEKPELEYKAFLTQIIDEDLYNNIFTKEMITIDSMCPDVSFVPGNTCGCAGNHTLAQVLSGQYCECFAAGGVTLTADQTIFSWVECSISFPGGGGGTGSSGSGGGGTTNNSETPDNYDPSDPSVHGNGSNSQVYFDPAIEEEEQEEKPCPGDPVKNPEIAPQYGSSGIKGALHGCTRYGDDGCIGEDDRDEYHIGIDIKNDKGKPIYAMFDGVVHSKYYQSGKAGYVIRLRSELPSGEIIIYQYFHMQNENRLDVGTLVSAGDIVGYQGDSGNLKGAINDGKVDSHVHIKMNLYDGTGDSNDYSNNFKSNPVNPADYMHTQIDEQGNSITPDCN